MITNINNNNNNSSLYSNNNPMEPTGTWINQHTGEEITIKTMVNDMSGSGSQIMLTDGRLMPFSEFSMNYIQIDNKDENTGFNDTNINNNINNISHDSVPLNRNLLLKGLNDADINYNNKTNININNDNTDTLEADNLEDCIVSTLLPEQNNISGNINTNISIYNKTNATGTKSKGCLIVEEFLDNLYDGDNRPKVIFNNLLIENMPAEPLKTFVNYLGVTKDDIVNVIYERLFNETELKNILYDYINNIVNVKNNTVNVKNNTVDTNTEKQTPTNKSVKIKRINKKTE